MLFHRDNIYSLKDSLDYDVKVLCCDIEIFTHRLVLASCSLWLRDILKISDCNEKLQVISMNDFNPTDLRKVFDFIYGRIDEIEDLDIFHQLKFWDFRPNKKEQSEYLSNSKRSPTTPFQSQELTPEQIEADDENYECIDPKLEVIVEEASEDELSLMSPVKKKQKRKITYNPSQSIHLGEKTSCPICHKVVSLENLSRHVRETHEKVKKPCPHCNKEFAMSNLSRHIRQVHNNESTECPECGKALTISNLNTHIKSVHKKLKKTCDICNEEFPYSFISVHKRKVHGIGKPVDDVAPRGPNLKKRNQYRQNELEFL